MIVEFEAVDRSGRSVTDTMDAPDVRSAMASLRKRDLIVTRVAEQGTRTSRRPRKNTRSTDRSDGHARFDGALKEADGAGKDLSGTRVSSKQLTMFTRQMSMLLNSGSGVVSALNSIGRQFVKPAHVKMIRQLCADLEEGKPLADALRRYPRVFGSSYCAVIAAGEASGTMSEMFTRLAQIVGKNRTMRNKILGALVYPALLSVLSFGIVNTLLFFVMPRFGDMFKTLDVDLPGSTAALLETARLARSNSIVIGVGAILAVGGIVALFTSAVGRAWISNALMHVPVVSTLIRGLILGESFRILGMLVEARVGFLDAIRLVKGVTGNVGFQNLYAAMESEVTSGGEVSKALESSGMVAPYICHAIHTGEESGNLGVSMSYVADVLDEDNTELLGMVTKLFEPAILIVMGVVVGAVAISLFLPMFDVTSALQ